MTRPVAAALDPPFDARTGCWSADMPASAEGLRSRQLWRAWEVAEWVAGSNPFYAARIRLPAQRTEAAFRSLSLTTKQDVVDDCTEHPPCGRRTVGAKQDLRHVVETSGTSGIGREVYALDAQDELAVYRGTAVGFWWAGVRPGTIVLLTLPLGMSAAGLWYYGGLRLLGANVLAVGAYPTERKVGALARYRPEVVVGTPSYIDRLATICSDEGLDPADAGVRSLVVAGEPYSVDWAVETQRRWNAVLYEQYGSTQRVMAWACPGGVVRDGRLATLHFLPELCYSEVLDPETGDPVADGHCGELISTPLQASASPLLRFATRDRVWLVAAGGCDCGRPLPGVRAGGVERYDDMMKIRGVNVWPAAFDAAVFGVAGVRDYRGRVSRGANGERVELRVECEPALGDALLGAVRDAVRRHTGLSVEVTRVAPGSLSREVPEGFVKVRRWDVGQRARGRS